MRFSEKIMSIKYALAKMILLFAGILVAFDIVFILATNFALKDNLNTNTSMAISFTCIAINVLAMILFITQVFRFYLSKMAKIFKISDSLATKEKEYKKKLHFDYLTGLYNKEYLYSIGESIMHDCNKNFPISVAIIDLDNFKQINDNYGHENGDVVLHAIGKLLKKKISKDMIIGRFGGEEFVFISINNNKEQLFDLLKEIKNDFNNLKFDFSDKKISFSAGIAISDKKDSFSNILRTADELLYEAKRNGKNKISFMEKIA